MIKTGLVFLYGFGNTCISSLMRGRARRGRDVQRRSDSCPI